MRKADLIAIDMDGTLLRSDNTLSNRNIEAVHAFHEAGGKVFLISGRPDGMTLPYVAELDDVDLYASFNGAYFGDRRGKALWSRPIEEKTLRSVYAFLSERKYSFSFLGKDGLHSNWGSFAVFGKQAQLCVDLARKHGLPEIWIRPFEEDFLSHLPVIYKIVIFKKDTEEDEELHASLVSGGELTVTSSRPFMFDVSQKGVGKGDTLLRCQKILGIPKERTAVLGDYYNDLVMFPCAGIRIAMGNAPEDVKKAADHVVSSNEEDGVAEAIERYLL